MLWGVSPYEGRNLREKCALDISAIRDVPGRREVAIYERARRKCARSASSFGVS